MIKSLLNPLYISLIVYIVFMGLILFLKPPMFYQNNDPKTKKLKVFGTGSKNLKTVFPLWFVLLICAIIIYFVILLFF